MSYQELTTQLHPEKLLPVGVNSESLAEKLVNQFNEWLNLNGQSLVRFNDHHEIYKVLYGLAGGMKVPGRGIDPLDRASVDTAYNYIVYKLLPEVSEEDTEKLLTTGLEENEKIDPTKREYADDDSDEKLLPYQPATEKKP